MNPDLMGKWISPMHPEIVKNEPGSCDICGMDLVSAESMGYVSADHLEEEAPLVIPASAPLITGKRAVVYLSTKPGHFEGRVVELGPRAGDYYIVFDGLEEGEQIVSRGSFKIDSAVQIQAKPSMMNPEGGEGSMPHHDHSSHAQGISDDNQLESNPPVVSIFDVPDAWTQSLKLMLNDYLELQSSLSRDSIEKSQEHITSLKHQLVTTEEGVLDEEGESFWDGHVNLMNAALVRMDKAPDIQNAREGFLELSNALGPQC